MITITVNRDGIEAVGHAGYAEYGKDIVCAGVSALTNAFIDSARKDIAAVEKQGLTRITVTNPTPETQAKLSMLVTGLQGIAKEFPEYVTIYDQAFMSQKGTIQSSIETITR